MDGVGWIIASAHSLLGHDKCAVVMGVDTGDKSKCLICAYERNPTAENKQAVIDALRPLPRTELEKEVAEYAPSKPLTDDEIRRRLAATSATPRFPHEVPQAQVDMERRRLEGSDG